MVHLHLKGWVWLAVLPEEFYKKWVSVNSKIKKANGPSSRSREGVICSWPPSPACTKSSRTDALIQLAGISAHPPLSLLAGSGVWESGMLSLIISQSSGRPELYMDAEVERVRNDNKPAAVNPQLLVVLFLVLEKSAQLWQLQCCLSNTYYYFYW